MIQRLRNIKYFATSNYFSPAILHTDIYWFFCIEKVSAFFRKWPHAPKKTGKTLETFLSAFDFATQTWVIQPSIFVILCVVSFAGSFISASMGIGGGGLVLAVMALYLPAPILIPLHGVVQIGSNIGRATLMAKHIIGRVIPVFLAGTLIGALIGGKFVISLPTPILQFVLALFILYSTWAPKFSARRPGNLAFFNVGMVSSFLTMFVGATGPLIAPFVAASSKKRAQVVATHAMLMSIQHSLKIIVFGFLGFAFGQYIPLLAGLLLFGFLGTWSGKKLLLRLPEKFFRIGLKTILTLIAIRLLYGAVF